MYIVMATNRCFDSFNTVLDARERSQQKRDTAIYNEIRKNVVTLRTGNPIKKMVIDTIGTALLTLRVIFPAAMLM